MRPIVIFFRLLLDMSTYSCASMLIPEASVFGIGRTLRIGTLAFSTPKHLTPGDRQSSPSTPPVYETPFGKRQQKRQRAKDLIDFS